MAATALQRLVLACFFSLAIARRCSGPIYTRACAPVPLGTHCHSELIGVAPALQIPSAGLLSSGLQYVTFMYTEDLLQLIQFRRFYMPTELGNERCKLEDVTLRDIMSLLSSQSISESAADQLMSTRPRGFPRQPGARTLEESAMLLAMSKKCQQLDMLLCCWSSLYVLCIKFSRDILFDFVRLWLR